MPQEILEIPVGTIKYLHQLRNSEVVNMMGAAPYLERDLGLSPEEAKKIAIAYLFGNFTKIPN